MESIIFTGLLYSVLRFFVAFFIPEPKTAKIIQPLNCKDLSSILIYRSLRRTSLISIIAHNILFPTIFGFTTTFSFSLGLNTEQLMGIVLIFMVPHALPTFMNGNVMVTVIGEWKSLFTTFVSTAVSSYSILFIPANITI